MTFRGIFILGLAFALSGCSLYQSDGRKTLEKNAIGLASAQANFISCQAEPLGPEWLKVSQTEEAEVFASEKEDFALTVAPSLSAMPFNCLYRFSSAQEMIERTDSAIEITVHELGLSLGGFAFRPLSHIK